MSNIYNAGFACGALSTGAFTGPNQLRGVRLCRDGSGVTGVWEGMVLANSLPLFSKLTWGYLPQSINRVR